MDEPPAHTDPDDALSEETRSARLAARRRGLRRRVGFITLLVLGVAGIGAAAYAVVMKSDDSTSAAAGTDGVVAAPAPTPMPTVPKTTTIQTTTTTTLPKVKQPAWVVMPSAGEGIGYGSRGPVVAAYETRMKQLHFDPGPVDGYFDQDTQYAVTSVQKYYRMAPTGRIDAGVQSALSTFSYSPNEPNVELDRVEIDLDRQTLTLFRGGQVALITTTSTGSGEHFCGGTDGCQYAITPAGHYHFYEFHNGWQKGKLGQMWNPYYFNGGIAVHGLASVPAYPASHGCARIPMHIADYFHTLVFNNMSVFVVGTPKKAGNGYVGPVHTPPPAPATTVPTVGTAGSTVPKSPTTVKSTPTTVKKPTTPTTVKKP